MTGNNQDDLTRYYQAENQKLRDKLKDYADFIKTLENRIVELENATKTLPTV